MSAVEKPPYPVSLREVSFYLEPDPTVTVLVPTGPFAARFEGVKGGKILLSVGGARYDLPLRPVGPCETGIAFTREGFVWGRGVEVVQVYYHRRGTQG